MSTQEDFATLLASVATYGSTLFVGTKPFIPPVDYPILVVVLTSGLASGKTHNAELPAYPQPGAQVTAIARSSSDAKTLCDSAYALCAKHNITLNGTRYLSIKPQQEPFDGGVDGRGRSRWRFNLLIEKSSA